MKLMKSALVAIAGLSLVAMSCQSAPAEKKSDTKAAKPVAEKPVGNTADVSKGTPTVDGEMDDLYASATVLKTEAKTMGDTDVYAEGRLLWDESFLYVFIDVKDPVLSDKSPNVWEQDSVEIVIDQNNGKTGAYQADDGQYRVGFKGVKSYGGNAVSKSFQAVAKTTDTGYVVEAAIPLNKVPGAAGNLMGFDFQVNEDPGKGTRTAIRCWNDTTNTNYQSTKNFGTITLK